MTENTETTENQEPMDELVAVVNRGQTQQIQFRVNEFKGSNYIDIRTYYFDENSEEFKPTRKGISIPVELYEELKEALAKVEGALPS